MKPYKRALRSLRTLRVSAVQFCLSSVDAMLSHTDSAAKMVLQHQQRNMQIVQRWDYGSIPLHLCRFSGSSRTSCRHKMTIQRLAPSQPPAISAGNMQNVQFVQ